MAKDQLQVVVSAKDMLALLQGKKVSLEIPQISLDMKMQSPTDSDLDHLSQMESAVDALKQAVEDDDFDDDEEEDAEEFDGDDDDDFDEDEDEDFDDDDDDDLDDDDDEDFDDEEE